MTEALFDKCLRLPSIVGLDLMDSFIYLLESCKIRRLEGEISVDVRKRN
jgi:hypothetical protein